MNDHELACWCEDCRDACADDKASEFPEERADFAFLSAVNDDTYEEDFSEASLPYVRDEEAA